MSDEDIYDRLIKAASAIDGLHPGSRVLHAKGTWCEGTFTASPDAARLSRAAIFSGDTVTALIRLSNSGGKPTSHDASRAGRGMAVKLRPNGPGGEGETDILAVTTTVFVARNTEDFLELLEARRPDPDTGQPDMERLGAYLGAHPEAQTSIQETLGSEPPASFATIPYYSPHTFKLLDQAGNGTWVRYRWRPEAEERRLPDDDARELGRDYLREELSARLEDGPARFELLLQVGTDDDPLDDPTAAWPAERELVPGGTLEVTTVVDDPEHGEHIEVFDPTRVGDGIELSDDPILRARRGAYSVSAYHRLGTTDSSEEL
jgi:catalase